MGSSFKRVVPSLIQMHGFVNFKRTSKAGTTRQQSVHRRLTWGIWFQNKQNEKIGSLRDGWTWRSWLPTTEKKQAKRQQSALKDTRWLLTMYICVCVCVCVWVTQETLARARLMRGNINKKDTHCETWSDWENWEPRKKSQWRPSLARHFWLGHSLVV